MFNEPPRWVPVVSKTGKPLIPCHPARARKLVAKGKAVKKYRNGFFYIRLTEREDGDVQSLAIGIDPGSMREAYTVMSSKRTYVNIQTHAADGKGIKKAVEGRRNARRARRGRTTPCRAPRWANRSKKDWLPPSTKARWQRKLNMVLFLNRLYPIVQIAIEDVSVGTKKGEKRRNHGFSPIQIGKNWLYTRLESLGYEVSKYRGIETASFRITLGLQKTKAKLASVFSAHCVDSWVLANVVTGGRLTPDLTSIVELIHHKLTRRQLHRFNPSKGGERSRYGGTISFGIKKGTLCTWKDKGKFLIGGNDGKNLLSLHVSSTGVRATQTAKPQDIRLIAYSPWRYLDHGVSTLPKEEKIVRRLWKLSTTLRRSGLECTRIGLALKAGTAVLTKTAKQSQHRKPSFPA